MPSDRRRRQHLRTELDQSWGSPFLRISQGIGAQPVADIPDEVQAVAVVTGDGRRYTGIRANEDSFTLQLRLPNESFKSFRKDRLKALVYEKKSLMPPYQLDASDLDNLLAYLSSLRGAVNSAADTQKAQGVH